MEKEALEVLLKRSLSHLGWSQKEMQMVVLFALTFGSLETVVLWGRCGGVPEHELQAEETWVPLVVLTLKE